MELTMDGGNGVYQEDGVSSTAPVTAALQSLWNTTGIPPPPREQEEHELVTVEHPLNHVATVEDNAGSVHRPKEATTTCTVDLTRDYGYKYDEVEDGNCCQAVQHADATNDADPDDLHSEGSSLLDPANFEDPLLLGNDSNDGTALATATSQTALHRDPNHTIYLLGRIYDALHDYDRKRHDENSLFWFTYRCDFPPIQPYDITTDAGWGCMLRSAQMMLGQALRMHYKNRQYSTLSLSLAQKRRDPFLRSVLTWMADQPTIAACRYSLHNMVATGMTNSSQILPGEWYGPGSACYVLRDLAAAHEARQLAQYEHSSNQHTGGSSNTPIKSKASRIFRVYVAPQGTVYKDEVHALMTKESRAHYEQQQQQQQQQSNKTDAEDSEYKSAMAVTDHPLATAQADLEQEHQHQHALQTLSWDTGLLLLIPLRLGLGSLHYDQYATTLAHTFSIPQSVGILGGRPRGARWFYGAYADGSTILGLDPHTVQDAPQRRPARVNGTVVQVVDISEDYINSIHTTSQERVPMVRMDPSIALGFYCKTAADLQSIQTSMTGWHSHHPTLPELFTMADTSPDYVGNGTDDSRMDDLMTSEDPFLNDDHDNDANASDEDEYVLL